MRFLVDAQLPRRIALWLREEGYDAVHTLDLPEGNRTTDTVILALSAEEDRIVITKDTDFVRSFLVQHQPQKLLQVSTGNIGNAELDEILRTNFAAILAAFGAADFVELTQTSMIVHG